MAVLGGFLPLATLRGAEVLVRFGFFALAAVLLSAPVLATLFILLAWLALASSVARAGLDRVATRHVAAALAMGQAGAARRTARLALLLSIGGGLAVGAATLLSVPLAVRWIGVADGDFASAMVVCGLILPVFTVTHVQGGILVGAGRPALGQLVQATVWPLALTVALLLGLRSAAGLLVVLGATQAVTGLVGLLLGRMPVGTGDGASPGALALMRDGAPIMALDLVSIGMTNLPLLALGHVASAEAVAGFGLAQRLFMLPWTMIMTIAALMAPRLAAAAAAGDRAELGVASRQAMLLARLTALPAALLLLVAPGFWLGLFGVEFRVAAGALAVLAGCQALHACWAVQDTVLAMTGLNRQLRVIVLAQAALILLSTAVLVPAFGVIGAALAVAGPLLVGAFGSLLAVRRYLARV